MIDPAPARDATKEKTVRLITVQRADILDHFDTQGVFRADWHAIGVTRHVRMAYDHVLSEMKAQGLSDGTHPPVWTWQTDRADAIGRSFELLSDAERDAHAYVLIELAVPDHMLLLSSYQGWCDLYFDCVETGRIHDDGHWRDWISVDIATYGLGIPALIIGQIAAFLLARNGFMRAAYRAPVVTLVPFALSTATLFVLS